eukprot:gnl/TRDRNA2_/TRDRNA2_162892_c0_seq1.p1 gnl/TRDRNA2_/TRDRNA2_162892_c0~~gnl/TRDRNA2_/TRDRNA2_162892_c0_seq1.p1  ORF type:complete len:247 (+),score=49.41 gnl/TRDRNA2_/TRDRNA2_162892_c0_seq1:32-772(+)
MRWRHFCSQSQMPEAVSGREPRRPSSVGTGLDDYVQKNTAVFQALLDLEPNDGWTFKASQDSVNIYIKRVPGKALMCFKGQSRLSAHGKGLKWLIDGIATPEERPKWDETCISGRLVERYPPFYSSSYYQIQSPAPIISNRDLLVIGRMRFEEDGGVLLGVESLELPSIPQAKSFVRCQMEGGYIFRPTEDPDIFNVTFAGAVDPKGWIPGWVVDFITWKQGLTLAKYAAYLSSLQQNEAQTNSKM